MSTLASIETYINSNLNIFPFLITAEIDIDVRKKMLKLDHNDHPNIQGGAAGERYHLTLDQYNSIAGLDLGTFVLRAGDTMDDNASLEFSNGVQNLKIDPVGLEVFWNTPSSANGYGSFSPTALHFDDNTAEQVDLTKTGLSIQNATFANSVAADEINFTHIASAKDHALKAIAAALVVSSTLATFKGFQYDVDLSANFEELSIPHVGHVENLIAVAVADYLPLAGGDMDSDTTVNFPSTGQKISINGLEQNIKLGADDDSEYNVFTSNAINIYKFGFGISEMSYDYFRTSTDGLGTVRTQMTPLDITIKTAEGQAVLQWFALKKTLDISGTNLVGLSISKTGGSFVIGDWFSDTVPYQCLREKGGTDTDQWELYAQKGVFIRTNSLATTALITATQAGKVGIKNESPTYDLDVTGDLNVTGDYRKSGTVGYIVSALGAASGAAPTLANCRTRTITINGVTVKMVYEL